MRYLINAYQRGGNIVAFAGILAFDFVQFASRRMHDRHHPAG